MAVIEAPPEATESTKSTEKDYLITAVEKWLDAPLEKGIPGSTTDCPIARTLRKVRGGSWSVAGPYACNGHDIEKVPLSAIFFMRKFDSGEYRKYRW